MLSRLFEKAKALKDSVVEKVNAGKKYVAAFVATTAAVAMTASVSAATPPADLAITTDMIEPLVDYIVQNIAVIMPVGITIMGIMVGIGLIPRIIRTFTHT